MKQGWYLGALGAKILSVGICDGAPSTVRSSSDFLILPSITTRNQNLLSNSRIVMVQCKDVDELNRIVRQSD